MTKLDGKGNMLVNDEDTRVLALAIRDAACLVASATVLKTTDAKIIAAFATDLSKACARTDLGVFLFPMNPPNL